MKRHARVDIDNEEHGKEQSSLNYLDANNLYGGAMHRMMPYELVVVPQREQVMKKSIEIRSNG